MKLAERGFGEFEMIGQQLGYGKGGFPDATARMIVSLPDHVIELMRHQPGHGAGIDKFLYFFRFFPQRRTEEGIQGRAVNIAERKNHSVRHGCRGKSEWSAEGVFEKRVRFGGTARASQANDGGEVVFRCAMVHRGILPFHANRRRVEEVIEFPLQFERSRGRDGRVRGEENNQSLLTRRERLRAANAGAHAEHAGEGEHVCNTKHSTHSVVQKI